MATTPHTRLEEMNFLANQALKSGKEEIAGLREIETDLLARLQTTQGEIARLEGLALATAQLVAATVGIPVTDVLKGCKLEIKSPKVETLKLNLPVGEKHVITAR